jgi:phage terminase large subunit
VNDWPHVDDGEDAVAVMAEGLELAIGGGTLVAHEGYQTRPLEWITGHLGVEPESLQWSLLPEYDGHRWDGDVDPLLAILDGLAQGRDVGVEAATGVGKSFLAACLVLWYLACFRDSRVYTYAPKEDQLRLFMWAEIASLFPRFQRHFPTAKLTDLRIRMDGLTDQWSAHGYAVKIRAGETSATGAQGAHARYLLLITEETPGIDRSVMEALRNRETNLQLALGNPDSQHDELHRFCIRPEVRAVRISALDHPNVVCEREVVPGATGLRSVVERGEEYGVDGRLYLSRVRGISPAEPADALIRRTWLEDAANLWPLPQFKNGTLALGVDVAASEAGDLAAIARGDGACLLSVQSFPCPDPVALGLTVGSEMKANDVKQEYVGVDSVGVGAGTVGRLREMGYKVRSLNAGEAPIGSADREAIARVGKGVYSPAEFKNLRAQMWWQFRVDLQGGVVAMPQDEELWDDLTTPLWFTRNGKIVVEPKEEIRKRLGRSPDKGDAAVMWNFIRPRPKFVPEKKPKKDPNVDTGLERIFERLQKQQQHRRTK